MQLQRSNGRTDGPGFLDVAQPRFDGRAYAMPRMAGGGPRLQTPPEIKRQARRLERPPAEDGDPFAAGRQSDDRAPAPGRSLSSGRAKRGPGGRGRLRRSARSRPDCRCERRSLAVPAGDIVDVQEQIAPGSGPGSGPGQAIAIAVTAGAGPVADQDQLAAAASGARQVLAVDLQAVVIDGANADDHDLPPFPAAYWCCPGNRRSGRSRQCRVNLAIAAGRSRSLIELKPAKQPARSTRI